MSPVGSPKSGLGGLLLGNWILFLSFTYRLHALFPRLSDLDASQDAIDHASYKFKVEGLPDAPVFPSFQSWGSLPFRVSIFPLIRGSDLTSIINLNMGLQHPSCQKLMIS
ncbi:Zinc finger CCHC domain-containing 4 [Gossypium arboreum]|uniref:Zinc finger CCHC domain-containing 4 n=1 Tax=Gossypium arboreum TaxID=29729 RepID=A0A0B0NY61_GOSAR|nr:Zinc finger CCHC domain-containing 4 [Gossypium arboreum]